MARVSVLFHPSSNTIVSYNEARRRELATAHFSSNAHRVIAKTDVFVRVCRRLLKLVHSRQKAMTRNTFDCQ